jgi:hypothetical protein
MLHCSKVYKEGQHKENQVIRGSSQTKSPHCNVRTKLNKIEQDSYGSEWGIREKHSQNYGWEEP